MSEDRDEPIDDFEDDLPEGHEDAEDDPPEDDVDPEEDADEDEGSDEPPAAAQPAKQPSRGERRFQELNERVRAAEARAAEAERVAGTKRQEDFQRQEAERLESMAPEERVEYRVNQRLARMEFNSWDTNDRVVFDGLAARNPAVASLKDEVEAAFIERARAGAPVDRSTIAKFLIGEKALSKAPRAKAAGARAAATGRDRNTVRPTNSRGDTPSTGSRRGTNEAEARRKRLENLEL